MSPLLLVTLVLLVSTAVAVVVARRLVRMQSPHLAPTELLPGGDPYLALVLRANRALGVWVAPGGGAAVSSAISRDLGSLAGDLVAGRLPGLSGAADGVEVLESGTLVFLRDGPATFAGLLQAGAPVGQVDALRADLARLRDDRRRQPQLAAVARETGRLHESLESVAMRLAHQLERLLDTEVAVALARPVGVQVLGISLRSDPRLLQAIAAPGSALERVARGMESGPVASDDPLGRSARERRRTRPGAVILPIRGQALPVGAVVLSASGGTLPQAPERTELFAALDAAGPRLASAMERAELEETATTDPLTGLRNRRGLERAMARIDQRDGVLVYADLDRFKQLNDALGHAAGDAALVHFARLTTQQVRTRDIVARIGGEEFALWLPDATLLEGAAVAERVRRVVAETAWAWQGRQWELTASFGLAGCPETVPAPEHLGERADEALYQAKRNGRNRVVTAM